LARAAGGVRGYTAKLTGWGNFFENFRHRSCQGPQTAAREGAGWEQRRKGREPEAAGEMAAKKGTAKRGVAPKATGKGVAKSAPASVGSSALVTIERCTS